MRTSILAPVTFKTRVLGGGVSKILGIFLYGIVEEMIQFDLRQMFQMVGANHQQVFKKPMWFLGIPSNVETYPHGWYGWQPI